MNADDLSADELSRFLTPESQPVCSLNASSAFSLLTPRERRYAFHFSQASWAGSLACLTTASPESAGIFCFLQDLFATEASRAVIEKEHPAVLQYAAAFYGNLSNYASFGDTKIVPRVPVEAFRAAVEAAAAAVAASASGDAGGGGENGLTATFASLEEAIYDLGPGKRSIGFNPEGVTNYYGPGITRAEAEAVQSLLTSQGVNVLNTRLVRDDQGGKDQQQQGRSSSSYVLLVASAETGDDDGREVSGRVIEDKASGIRVVTRRGDFSRAMTIVADEIEKASAHAAGEHQTAFCRAYAEHFRTGAHAPYVESQKAWVRDVGPSVETNIGYVETYTDPLGVRAEFEGMVACVNKDTSAKFAALVAAAEPLIAQLPWPKFMEKEKFLKPDFTSLEVVTFGSRGIPAGINIPNLEDVRATHGFKNVSLQNVLAARVPEPRTTFLKDADQELFRALQPDAFAVQVGIHELLGHGSGRLLVENQEDGSRNFDPSTAKDPLTGEPVQSWYRGGATWESVFTNVASSYEECRAEAVGVYLCTDPDVQRIFGHTDPAKAADVAYVNWVNMVRAGLVALEQYDPSSGVWGQAHMRARYAILQVLLRDGKGCTRVTRSGGGGEEEDVVVEIDRDRLDDARAAIGDFLVRLQTYKSTGNLEGRKMYESLTEVPKDWVDIRNIVLRKKKPRNVFVQPHLEENDKTGDIDLVEFPATPRGVIDSYQRRFPPGTAQKILEGYF